MKRIAIDARMWRAETGGIGRYTRNLVTELLQIDTENEYTLILTPEDAAECLIEAPNLKKLVLPIGHYSMAEQKELPKILKKEAFDLVHFTSFNHPLLYRGPFVCTIHDLIMHFYPSGRQRTVPIRRLAYMATMFDTHRAKKIIVPSEATKRDIIKWLHISQKKLVVTPEGSEAGIFHTHTPQEIAAIKEKYNLPDRFIVFVSRWERYKGILALVDAFETLSSEFPDLALVIMGKPRWQDPEIGQVIKQKQEDGLRIITPGFVSDTDLAVLYSAASVYCHPSWYEGFGIMILEAFASGVPVVTSRNSSLPEVAGDAALLIDPNEPKQITGAIRQILTDPALADDLRTKGFQRLEQFSWEKMARQTHDIYLEILSKQKPTQ